MRWFRSTALAKACLVAGGLVMALGAAEIALRVRAVVTDPARRPVSVVLRAADVARDSDWSGCDTLRDLLQVSRHPDVVYELKPGLQCSFRGVEVRTNSHGMRDREYSTAKPEGIVRVAGLGDSVMFGWGVAEADSFLRVAERRLRELRGSGPRIQVMNFAVPGYNTAMEVANLEARVLDFQPDAVVIHLVNNDLELPRFMFDPVDPWSIKRFWLADLLRARGGARQDHSGWIDPRGLASLDTEVANRMASRYGHLAGEAAMRNGLSQLAASARERSIPVVVMALQDHGLPWRIGVEAAARNDFMLEVYGPRFSEYLVRNGPANTTEAWIGTFWLSSADPHPNVLGHRLMADALVHALARCFSPEAPRLAG
jgi:lysophospholipase L1-like esterase